MGLTLSGNRGWALLLALVVIVDVLADEDQTLTDACHRARREHPTLVHSILWVTTFHLLAGDHPTLGRFDLFRFPARALRTTRRLTRIA